MSFVGNNVTRNEPDVRYWSALVSDGMLQIDQEWPSIQEVMNWLEQAGDRERFVDGPLHG
jgi:hypothetical protein